MKKAKENCRQVGFEKERYIAEICGLLRLARPGYVEAMCQCLHRRQSEISSDVPPKTVDPVKEMALTQLMGFYREHFCEEEIVEIHTTLQGYVDQFENEARQPNRNFVYRRADV